VHNSNIVVEVLIALQFTLTIPAVMCSSFALVSVVRFCLQKHQELPEHP